MENKNVLSRARDFYAIYCASSEGLNYERKPCPRWDKLTPAVRTHWCTVALRSIQLQLSDPAADNFGEEKTIIPNTLVLDHLGDDARVESAITTWTEYWNA